MKNNPLQKLRDEAFKISLTPQERASMRARIFESMRPVGGEVVHRTKSPYFFFAPRFAMSMAAFLIVALGGGTAFAAQSSLPGEPLYPIKIYVNESVAEALSVTEEAKVTFHTNAAQERLREAQELTARGELDASVAAQIEENVEKHIAKADAIALALHDVDPAAAVDAEVHIESALTVQSDILDKLSMATPDEETKKNSSSIALRVRSRGSAGAFSMQATAPAIEATMMALDAPPTTTEDTSTNTRSMKSANKAVSVSASTTQKKIAAQLEKKANKELRDAKTEFTRSRVSLNASTTAKIETRIAALEKDMENGRAQLNAGAYEIARETFTSVYKGAIELEANIKASKKFNRDLVRRFLNERYFGIDTDEEEKNEREERNEAKSGKDGEDGKSGSSGSGNVEVKTETQVEQKTEIKIPGTNVEVHL
ncbi:MAG TPA: DUF5667 domain-containing protein, partial [Candidatus Paceibacterota bacterium]|nr:DUF5667 domain-containing protein [Candidatus Paceibacterota bacterium]